jgi:O-antigen/teichoic acid export membrane protein
MTSKSHLKTRYFYKLLANIIGLATSVAVQLIVPRGLGPEGYGVFHFLTNFFKQLVGFLDMGTSTAFYTKLSQRQKDHGLLVFYLLFMLTILTTLFALVVISHWRQIHNIFWPEQELIYVYLSATLAALIWIEHICTKMGDAYSLTVSIEKLRIKQKIFALLLITLLYSSGMLSIETYFLYNYIIVGFFIIGQIWIMVVAGKLVWPLLRPTLIKIRSYFDEFYIYSRPLFLYGVAGLVVGLLDRWLLQTFSGSMEQGFYSLAYQIGAICFLFTSSMTPLLHREFSISFDEKNIEQMQTLFRRYIPLLSFVAAFFGCFISVQAEYITFIFGGAAYSESVFVISLMALFTIHQTYGQLSGSFFLATGSTALYSKIGIIFMIIGLPTTYFLVATTDNHGLDLGSMGLAIKMVSIQILAVNVQLYYNTKTLNLSFIHFLWHQIYSVVLLFVLAFFAEKAAAVFVAPEGIIGMLVNFILAGFIYCLAVFFLVYNFPKISGLQKGEIRSGIKSIHNWLLVKGVQ